MLAPPNIVCMPEENENNRRTFIRNVGLISLSTLGVGPGVVSANSKPQINTLPPEYRPSAHGVTVLTPKTGTKKAAQAANITAVLLIEKDDGGYKEVIAGSGDRSLEYCLKVDPESGTYEVTNFQMLNPAEIKTQEIDSDNGQKHTRSSSGTESSSSSVSIQTTTATSNYGPYTVQITTHDPFECKLCRTKQTLEWAYDSSNNSTYITDRSWTAVWWDPTGCGTNWKYDWAKFVDRYEGADKCYTECEGQYYNDNYGNDNNRTYSWHKVHNTGYSNGTKDYWATADHWGEGSGNLHTHVRLV